MKVEMIFLFICYYYYCDYVIMMMMMMSYLCNKDEDEDAFLL